MRTRITLPLSLMLIVSSASLATAQTPAWTKKLGTNNADFADAAAPANSGVYVAGTSDYGVPSALKRQAWVYKLDAAGNTTWFRELGTPQHDLAHAAAADGADGAFIGGTTWGSLAAPLSG